MRRVETYVGQQVYEWLFSAQAQNNMTAMAKVCAALFGTGGIVNGLACAPTSPATMTVQIGAGELYQMENLEATACGTLPADTAHTILKQGIQLGTYTTTTFAAPGSSGQSINYLIEAQYQDSDISLDPTTGVAPVVLQFYNSSNPATPWSGPNNSGATSNTFRDGVIAYQIKPGVAATTGTQVTPSPDTGWLGLWVVTVPFGASSLTAGNIAAYNGAPVLSAPILTQIQQAPVVVGASRNLTMTVAAALATASLTADEIVVESALGGNTYKLANFSKAINLAGTPGAGAMDTGSAPTNGYVALYAIYNPTTGASALLARNATSAVQPNVYGGANMPAGYTASALVSVWPTNGSGQFVVGFQRDRSISINSVTVLSTSVTQASPTALSVSSAIPPNAVGISGTIASSSSAAATTSIQLNPIASINVGIQGINFSSTSASGGGSSGVFRNLQVSSPQTIYYTSSNSAGTPTYAIAVMGYDF